MKLTFRLVTLIFLVTSVLKSYAQSIDNYVLTRAAPTVSYTSIIGAGGTALTTSGTIKFLNNKSSSRKQDNRSTAIPLGFDFVFNGTVFSEVRVSSNGFIDFNFTSNSTSTSDNTKIRSSRSTSSYFPVIAPIWDDLEMDNENTNVYYKSDATNKKFTVEWTNMEHNNNGAKDNINFQVIVNGNTGVIEFNYGTMYTYRTSKWSYSCGLADMSTIRSVSAATVKLQSTANTALTNQSQTSINPLPSSNSRLTFTPPSITTAAAISAVTPGIVTAAITWTSASTSPVAPFKYQIIYKRNVDATWSAPIDVLSGTTYTLTGLEQNTLYNAKVLTCTEGRFVTSAAYNFTTLPLPNPSASDSITFSNTSTVSMELAWTDFASGVPYTLSYSILPNSGFIVKGTTNSPSYTVTGLSPNTLYYFKVVAVAGATTSTALTGNASTTAYIGSVIYSNQNGNWNTGSSWLGGLVPGATNTVIVRDNITMNSTATVAELSVNQGSALSISSNRTLTINNDVVLDGEIVFNGGSLVINGNLYINATGAITTSNSAGSNGTLTVNGNIFNLGSIGLYSSSSKYVTLNFTAAVDQTIGGSGSFDIYRCTINKTGGSGANTVYMQATDFTTRTSYLTLTNGIFNLNTSAARTFQPFSSSAAINSSSALIMNSPNATLNMPNTITGGGLVQLESGTMGTTSTFNFTGHLKIDGGLCTIGNNNDEDLRYNNNSTVTINGGVLNVTGQLRYNSSADNFTYNQTAGDVTLGIYSGNSNNYYALDLSNSNKVFTMSGGTLTIQNTNSQNEAINLSGCSSSTSSITGGTISLSSSATSGTQSFVVENSNSIPFYNVTVPNGNATVTLNQAIEMNDLNSVGIFNANSKSVIVKGNFDISGTYFPGTNTTTFNGDNDQSISMLTSKFNALALASGTANTVTLMNDVEATGNVTIAASNTFELAENVLTVGGNLTNNGTLVATAASFIFNGTSTQTISTFSDVQCLDVSISNSNGVTIANNSELQVKGSVTLSSSADLTTNGKLTLLEDEDYSGRIAELPSGCTVIGDVKIEKCIQGDVGYIGLGSLHTSIDFEQWDNDLLTTGIPNSDYPTYNFVTIYSYNESATGGLNNGFVPISNMTNTMQSTSGYYVYVYPQTLGAYGNCYVKLTTIGNINQSDVNFNVTYTNTGSGADDGWNMITNCYPSAVDWNSATGWTKSGITSINIFDRAANGGLGQYMQYQYNGGIGIGANGGNRYIPSGQSFWVKAANSSSTLIMKEAAKVPDFQPITREEILGTLSLTLQNAQFYSDETVLYFNENATQGFDVDYDAPDLPNAGVPSIFVHMNDSVHLSIYGSNFAANDTIPLFVSNPVSGQLRIEAENLFTPNGFACITLFDAFTNTYIDLNQPNAIYNFQYEDTTTITRFYLYVRLKDDATVAMVGCKGEGNGSISILANNNEQKSFVWTNALGTVLQTDNNVTSTEISNLLPGVYNLNVTENSHCGGYDTTFTITEPDSSVVALFTMPRDTMQLENGSVEVTFENHSSFSNFFSWIVTGRPDTIYDYSLITSFNQLGVYEIQLIAKNGFCADTYTKNLVIVSAQDSTQALHEAVLPEGIQIQQTNTGYTVTSAAVNWNNATCTVIDITGRELAQVAKKTQSGVEVDLTALPRAVYFLRIAEKGEQPITLKLGAL